MGLLYIELSYLCKGCIIKGTKLLLALLRVHQEFIIEISRSELRYKTSPYGSLAEWFKAPDLGSGIFGCVSSNLTALILLPFST